MFGSLGITELILILAHRADHLRRGEIAATGGRDR